MANPALESAVGQPSEDELSHLYLVLYGELGMCGCGTPAAAFDLVRDLLMLCPYYEDGGWRRVQELIGSPGAVHLVLSALDRAKLIDHGSVITGSWLTDKGSYVLHVMQRTNDDALDDVGFPHNGGDCTDQCWRLP